MAAVATLEAVSREWVAAAAFFGSGLVIDLAAIRYKKATISRWLRQKIHEHPVAAAGVAASLAVHLVFEIEGDPLRWAAGRWAAGMAARQTGDTKP